MASTSDTKNKVCRLLWLTGAASLEDMSKILSLDKIVLSRVLINMDDEGLLIMRNGWYRLSEVQIQKMRKNHE